MLRTSRLIPLAVAGVMACQSDETPEPALEAARHALGLCGEPLCFLAADTLLNTTVSGAQDTPALATAPDGTSLLVFRDRSGLTADPTNGDALRGRFFTAAGLALGDDFVVETTTARLQQNPAIACSTTGVFLVVWADNRGGAPDVSGYAIRGRRFSASGTPLDAADFVVNLTTTSDQTTPVVAATSNGGFLIAWRDASRLAPDVSSGAIRVRRLGPDGTLAATDLIVNTTFLNDQSEPALAVAADGRWAVSFTDASLTSGDAAGTQVRLRLFGADDVPAGPDLRLSARSEGDQRQSDLAFAPDGTLLVVFTDHQVAGAALGYEIRGRRLAADGTLLGEEFDVASTRGRNQSLPAVTVLDAEGRWLVAFTDDSRLAPDVSGTGVRGRLLAFDGAFDGPDQLLPTATYGSQTSVALSARTGASVLLAWADSGNVVPDVAAPAIRGRWLRFARCGDGRVEAEQGEQCDDGNLVDGDGCSSGCFTESCGDGRIQSGEACDDGAANRLAGPCLPDCTPARCGDSVQQANESCDDGNLTDGDGCSSGCGVEPPSPAACAYLCRPTATFDACNGNDDDCDGQIDEDGAKGFDTNHCGGCDQGPCPVTAPYGSRLSAPAGPTQWEPSGAAVIGNTLWVSHDKSDGTLAAYALPLAVGANAPIDVMTVRPSGLLPKWEGLRWEATTSTLLLLNATGSTVWRCDPGTACVSPTSVNVAATVAALGAATRLESLVPVPPHLFLGSRASPSKMADEGGVLASFGNLSPDGRAYQMSDGLFFAGRFYSTWSYEGGGTTLNDVAGLLAVTEPDANGRPDPTRLRICRTLAGKPEGFDVWGDDFVIVFDEDDARKAKGNVDPLRFALRSTEDFATLVPRGTCD